MRTRVRLLLAATVVLPLLVCIAMERSFGVDPSQAALQATLGGVGAGPAVALTPCAAAFDPRVSHTCSWRHDPLPLGVHLCPAHSFGALR
ncbi:MAG: hypothetical protein OER88_06505 [Planctomycetota bacterium]|nr:hypothetical protein [Planctomycetota bacterium]